MSRQDELGAFAGRAGLRFRDGSLLARAFMHSSYLNENSAAGESNERLEFLGDAVVNLVLAQELFARVPGVAEGELSRRRWELASRRSLAQAARRLDMGRYLLMGRGEASTGGRERESTLGSAFEAVVGAVLLDSGYEAARAFVQLALAEDLERVASQGVVRDHKTELQELALSRGLGLPEYRTVGTSGPDHARSFEVEVSVGGNVVGRGTGTRTRDAEQAAAEEAIRQLREQAT